MNHLDSDYFSMCSSTGDQFAGRHILADFWGVERMSDLDFIKKTIEESARKAGANILHSYYHPFGDGMGVSGVTVLSESHISIHTWPELGLAKCDIFCCGEHSRPKEAVEYLHLRFKSQELKRWSCDRSIPSTIVSST